MARHLCRFYNKHLNHCQLLQIQQFFFLNSINSLAKMNKNMVTFYLTDEFLKEQRMKYVWF